MAGLLAPACKKPKPAGPPPAPPQLALRTIEQARGDLVAQVILPSVDKTLATVGQVAQRLGLPFSEADARKTLARGQIPAAALDKIDLARPVAAVVLVKPAPPAKGPPGQPVAQAGAAEPVLSWALKNTSATGFDAFVAALGQVGKRDLDAVMITRGDAGGPKALWMVLRNGAVCAAEERDLLVAGCALALEARKQPAADLGVVLIPEGLARANGTTVADALATARQALAAEQAKAAATLEATGGRKGQPKPDPKMQAALMNIGQAFIGRLLDMVADVSEARGKLSLDAAKGFGLTVEAQPRPGSEFAKRIGGTKAYTVDPALLVGEAPAALMAMSDLGFYRDLLKAMEPLMLEATKDDRERTALTSAMNGFFGALAGPASVRFGFTAPAGAGSKAAKLAYDYDLVYALAPNVDGKKLLSDMAQVSSGPWVERLFSATGTGIKFKLSNKQDREGLTIRMVTDTRGAPPELRKAWQAMPMLDGRPVEGRAVVEGDRLLMAFGSDPKAKLAALRKPPEGATPPAGDVAAALAETQGDESLFYSDLAALMRPVLASLATSGAAEMGGPQGAAMLGRISAIVAPLRLATWGSHRGGEALTLRWRIPMTTMESAGNAVRGFMGLRDGGPPAGGPGAP
jgi:hypothetical protein